MKALPSVLPSFLPSLLLVPDCYHLSVVLVSFQTLLHLRIEVAKLNCPEFFLQQDLGLASAEKKYCIRFGRQKKGRALSLWWQLQACGKSALM